MFQIDVFQPTIAFIIKTTLRDSTNITLPIDFFQSTLLVVSELSKSVNDDSKDNVDEQNVDKNEE